MFWIYWAIIVTLPFKTFKTENNMRKTFGKILAGVLILSVVAVACNNKKDKKEEPPKEDTTKVEPAPPMPPDTTQMDKDTGDVRPVKPGE
jgi:hypothetical protein